MSQFPGTNQWGQIIDRRVYEEFLYGQTTPHIDGGDIISDIVKNKQKETINLKMVAVIFLVAFLIFKST
jgi:hypothetical protein